MVSVWSGAIHNPEGLNGLASLFLDRHMVQFLLFPLCKIQTRVPKTTLEFENHL